jgi:uncharacterized integral membrane protein
MTRRLLYAVAFALLALCAAAFVRLNAVPVALDLFFAPVTAGVGQALVLAFALGWLFGIVSALGWVGRIARERVRLERELRLADAEARTLRATAPPHAR